MIDINLRRLFVSLVLSSVLVLASFSVVFADGPVITGPTHFEGSDEVWDCGAFQILDNWTMHVTGLRFFDESDDLVRVIGQAQGTDTLINAETGKAYRGSFHNTFILNLDRLTGPAQITAGVSYLVTVPGAGAVVLDVGLFMFNLSNHYVYFWAGLTRFLRAISTLCARHSLSPPATSAPP
jgi:hypothetical protein